MAGAADTISLLPAELQERYRTPLQLLRTKRAKSARRPYLGMAKEEYPRLIQKLFDSQMITLRTTQPRVINGVFAVSKGGSKQRLIFDARNANDVFKLPPKLILPTPDLLTSLVLKDGQDYVSGKPI